MFLSTFRLPALLVLLMTGLAPVFAADGAAVYQSACAKCHGGGPGGFFTGAPKLGGKVMELRLARAGSIDGLLPSVKNGLGNMPPQGGDSGLSDADLKAAIEFMLVKKDQ
jgi:cytochrome c5